MCAIIGAALRLDAKMSWDVPNSILNEIFEKSLARGRDGFGYEVSIKPDVSDHHFVDSYREPRRVTKWADHALITGFHGYFAPTKITVIGNMRAEPTTEFVDLKDDSDQQPYSLDKWSIVHNGTIANDRVHRTYRKATAIDSAAIVELLANSGGVWDESLWGVTGTFAEAIGKLQGSYAILATHKDHPGLIFAACNYRPIWYAVASQGIFLASSREYFPKELTPVMLEPYSVWAISPSCLTRIDKPTLPNKRALVVCSGGMDSVVAAAQASHLGYDIELLHFRYGSRAEVPELIAIHEIAKALCAPLHILPMAGIYSPSDSPLLRADDSIAGGEKGAEFAHEWVPARNLVMLALATAFAEAKGFGTIVLGNNLEEAGAYPDNEPEFINRFNDMLPFAVADGKRIEVIMPVGNLMKHEIVALGHKLGAPLHLTWSCYRAGALHCGTCGPCYMRRKAFEINDLPEVIQYEGK